MSSKKTKVRKWQPSEKLRIVLSGLEGDVSIADLCRREGLKPTQYYTWKKQLLGAANRIFDTSSNKPTREQTRLAEDLSRAKDVIAEITSENLTLKKTLSG